MRELIEYAWCLGKKNSESYVRFRTKSSVEQYLTVYKEKSTSEIIKKNSPVRRMVRKWQDLT